MILIWLLFGILILLFSTQFLVRSAVKLSQAARISPLVVGVTVVAIGTSLPELSVSAVAAIKGDGGLALGNIVGSNILNMLMVFPAGVLLGKLRIGMTKTQKSVSVMTLITFLFFGLWILWPSYLLGVALLSAAVLVTALEYKWGITGRDHEDILWVKKGSNEKIGTKRILILLASLVGVVSGGLIIVNTTESISAMTGYSTTLLGMTLTALATSLPELLTTIFAEKENQEKVVIGNIVGSNIYNLLLIGGVTALFSSGFRLPIIDWSWLLFVSLLFFGVLKSYSGKIVPKKVSIVFLLLLGLYLVSQTWTV